MADTPRLNIVNGMRLCDLCLDGKGGMCQTPGCMMIWRTAPDLELRKTIIEQGGEIRVETLAYWAAYWAAQENKRTAMAEPIPTAEEFASERISEYARTASRSEYVAAVQALIDAVRLDEQQKHTMESWLHEWERLREYLAAFKEKVRRKALVECVEILHAVECAETFQAEAIGESDATRRAGKRVCRQAIDLLAKLEQEVAHVPVKSIPGTEAGDTATRMNNAIAKLEPEVGEDDDTAQQIFAAKVQNLQARLSDISNALGELHKWRDNMAKLEPEVQT